MSIEILMPALSPTMTEGNLAKWHKAVGDKVQSGDVIAEIETDKATMEVEAVDDGVIGKILVPEGSQGIQVNAPIAVLLEEGEDASSAENYKAASPAAPAAPKEKPQQAVIPEKQEIAPKTPNTSKEPEPKANHTQNRIIASPLAKRIAKDKGIDLSSLKGTGPNGRIVKADVLAGKSTISQKGSATAPKSSIDAKAMADALGRSYQEEPNTQVRKIIASRLLEAKQTIPHFYLTIECAIDPLLALRKQINDNAEGFKISVNDFIVKAVAKGLKDVPAANASWQDDAILLYDDIDVSVAVATPSGLITPVVKQADIKPLSEISNEVKDLAGRAKENKLKPEEFQGGGFTISNLGMYGIKEFSAIINPPQSCILAVGAGEQRAIVKDGEIKIATMMSCTLSVDHRSVDGAVGAEFLKAFKKYIENPSLALV